jgi:hypothetical protein
MCTNFYKDSRYVPNLLIYQKVLRVTHKRGLI